MESAHDNKLNVRQWPRSTLPLPLPQHRLKRNLSFKLAQNEPDETFSSMLGFQTYVASLFLRTSLALRYD